MGIDSIKIEGRMRTPYYTATVTSIYRNALDNEKFKLTKDIMKKLESAYSREFTEGCFSNKEVFNRKQAQGTSKVKILDYNVPIRDISINRKNISVNLPKINAQESKKQLLVRTYNIQDATDAEKLGADIIFLDLFHPDFIRAKEKVKNLYAVVPRIVYDSDLAEIERRIKEIQPKGLLAGNLAVLNISRRLNLPVYLDYNCNCFNDLTLAYYHSLNAFPIISPELSIPELLDFKNKDFAVFAHGKIRLMTLTHQLEKETISDRKGSFLISKIKNGSEIINSKELGLFNKIRPLIKEGINSFYIDTDKNIKEIVPIYKHILEGKTPDVSKIRQEYVLGWREGVE
jgi:collagenase-like PrtC family protease